MTFLEAAIEILRNAEEPLHFTEVARRAVQENLLSHVGRDPEGAMRTCLNSASRGGHDTLIVHEKSGYYGIRPGAKLPEPPARPAPKSRSPSRLHAGSPAEKSSDSRSSKVEPKVKSKVRPSKKTTRGSKGRKRPGTVGTRARETEAAEPEDETLEGAGSAFDEDGVDEDDNGDAVALPPVEFVAPSGSGLDGVTDVALVMANAMSRLVEERPELRDELDAIQQPPPRPAPMPVAGPSVRALRSNPAAIAAAEERGGRRRRRRRRRGKRVDWSATGPGEGPREGGSVHEALLDAVVGVLEESGPRSLHVRQIAETLAGRGLLGGEISEIERAVTAAVLLDLHAHGRASRFVARGDARYQLQGTRLPEAAAQSEQQLRLAVAQAERETENQIIQWLQALGSRSLESLVRIWLQREGYALVAALPPARGVGKLLVEDPEEDDGRVLTLVIPRRTALEPRAWDGEAERNGCAGTLLFVMGDPPDELGEGRVIGAGELAAWLRVQRIGVQVVRFEVPLLDMTIIESIGGLDT